MFYDVRVEFSKKCHDVFVLHVEVQGEATRVIIATRSEWDAKRFTVICHLDAWVQLAFFTGVDGPKITAMVVSLGRMDEKVFDVCLAELGRHFLKTQ